MSVSPRVCVLNAPGINCNVETGAAFEQAGAEIEQVHISQLNEGERKLEDYQILALSGGFSYGDVPRSGAILGLELKKLHAEKLNRFVAAGKAVLGICNGFQVLVESGLLPHGRIDENQPKEIALIHNQNDKFECRWTKMKVTPETASKFINVNKLDDYIELPVAHGEGRFVVTDDNVLSRLLHKKQVSLSYAKGDGKPAIFAWDYPDNPNGSPMGITGLSDESGLVNGLMPHPERFVRTQQHPNWRRGEGESPFGAMIFKNIVEYVRQS